MHRRDGQRGITACSLRNGLSFCVRNRNLHLRALRLVETLNADFSVLSFYCGSDLYALPAEMIQLKMFFGDDP